MPTRIKYSLFSDGSCSHPEAMVMRGGRWKVIRFPSMMALLEHPSQGLILFDTGYTERFFEETARFPGRIYRWMTPVRLDSDRTARRFIERRGFACEDVRQIILSHFHADHAGGLKDFPNATVRCSRQALDAIVGKQGFGALAKAMLPGLLPEDLTELCQFIENSPTVPLPEPWRPFTEAWDLLGDGSLLAVDLPGHAAGQFGIIFHDPDGAPIFLVADASWRSRAIRENLPPPWAAFLIQDDRHAYLRTLERLHQLHQHAPEVRLVPTHCDEIWNDPELCVDKS